MNMKSIPHAPASAATNNPFVAALGSLPQSLVELAKRMTPDVPVPTDTMRTQGELARFIALGSLEDVYVPTSRDITAAMTIMRLINRGYVRRPPTPRYWLHHQAQAKALANPSAPLAGRSSAPSFSFTGTSGLGKSTSMDMILNLYPTAVQHDQEENPLLPRFQVPTLKITCPVNRTPRAFMGEFFTGMQNATGIDYSYCQSRRFNDDEMIIEMGRIARLHCLGLLVFDEVQQVVGGDDRLRRLLVRLTNTVQVPIVFVGTPHAQGELHKQLATARRMLGETWLPFKASDPDWEDIVEVIWNYQVTRTPTMLDAPLKAKMHELTCGIPALAKALYTFAQEHLILNSQPEDSEEITTEILHAVFHDKMASVIPAMNALSTGKGLEEFDDLLPDKLPKPTSWREEKQLEDAVNVEFYRAAISAARRTGKAFALSQITGAA